MRVLGVDCGLAHLGLADVDVGKEVLLLKLGVIATEGSKKKMDVLAAHDNVRRLRELCQQLVAFAGHPSEGRFQVICAERFSAPRNASAAAKMALSWGALVMYAELCDPPLPILQVSPQELKDKVTGSKSASKIEVQDALTAKFPNVTGLLDVILPGAFVHREHPCDAFGAVIACLDSDVLRFARTMAAGR